MEQAEEETSAVDVQPQLFHEEFVTCLFFQHWFRKALGTNSYQQSSNAKYKWFSKTSQKQSFWFDVHQKLQPLVQIRFVSNIEKLQRNQLDFTSFFAALLPEKLLGTGKLYVSGHQSNSHRVRQSKSSVFVFLTPARYADCCLKC